MSNKPSKSIILLLLLGLTLLTANGLHSVNSLELAKGKKFVILIDQFHNQTISTSYFMPLLQELNKTIPVKVAELHERITLKHLTGVDLLIIPPKTEGLTYISSETDAMNEYLRYGGSILVLGGFNKTIDLSNMDFLLRSLEINDKSIRSRFTFHLEPVEQGEDIVDKGVYLYNELTPFEEKSLLDVKLENQEITSIINTNATELIVQSVAITVKTDKAAKIIAPMTTYGRDADGYICCYTNSTPVIGAIEEFNNTRVALLGFGEALTNMTSPLGKPWIELGDNLVFFKDLLLWLLKPELYKPQNIIRPTYITWYFIVFAIIITPLTFVLRMRERKKEAEKEEKERQVSISEVLKKVREERKESK